MSFPWLTILFLVPLLGGILVAFLPSRDDDSAPTAKRAALVISLVTLALAVVIAVRFQVDGGYQFTEDKVWIRLFGAHYALGVDGLGLSLVLLTAILTPVVLLAGWNDGLGGGSARRRSLPGCWSWKGSHWASSWPPTCSCSTSSSRPP